MVKLELLTMLGVKAADQKDLYDQINSFLLSKDFVMDSFMEALAVREAAYPTAIATRDMGVAIPHVDVEHVKKNGILTVTLTEPVTFKAMGCAPEDNETVSVECLFVILLNARDDHIKLLTRFVKVIQNPVDLAAIRFAENPEIIEEILKRYLDDSAE